jgi:hypothetical protein
MTISNETIPARPATKPTARAPGDGEEDVAPASARSGAGAGAGAVPDAGREAGGPEGGVIMVRQSIGFRFATICSRCGSSQGASTIF